MVTRKSSGLPCKKGEEEMVAERDIQVLREDRANGCKELIRQREKEKSYLHNISLC